MSKRTTFLAAFLMTTAIVSCETEDTHITDALSVEQPVSGDGNRRIHIEDRAARPTVLGKQKENPYSVANMQHALDSLLAHAHAVGDEEMYQTSGIATKSLETVSVGATDLYVRFLPKDTAGYAALKSDTTLELFDIPLDYDIVQLGDYYHDPALPDSTYTWQYAVVKPGYEPPQGVDYEILEELFLIENSPSYSEEILWEEEATKAGQRSGVIDNNLRKALLTTSFVLTGNEKELRKPVEEDPLTKSKVTTCSRYCIFWGSVCWTDCDDKYYPSGTITVNTPSGNVGVKGARIRTWRWFNYITAYTNSSGIYQSTDYYKDALLWEETIYYQLFFDGRHHIATSNTWTFDVTMFGAVCLWESFYGFGWHDASGYSATFYTNSSYWGRVILHNAIYDYLTYTWMEGQGLAYPPSHLSIASKSSSDFSSSAPLLTSHFNWMTYPLTQGVIGHYVIGGTLPDLILRFNSNLNDYQKMTAVCWHELTHGSHLQRMKSELGYTFASNFWSSIVYQEVSNDLSNGKPYGTKGGANWQLIALAEGWAYYREWELARVRLAWNTAYTTAWSNDTRTPVNRYPIGENFFPQYFSGMFFRLRNIGCSHINMETSICSTTITGFRDKLIAKYPNLRTQITNIVREYL